MKKKTFNERRPKGMSRAGWMMNRATFKALHYDRQKATVTDHGDQQPNPPSKA